MLDAPVRRLIDPWLDIPAAKLTAWNISANTVTVAGFFLGMLGCTAIAFGQPLIGLAFLLANRLADGLDGCIARSTQSSDLGGFLDIVLDILFYGAVPLSFAIADPDALLAAAFLLHSFMGTSGSFLAFAVICAKRGITVDSQAQKSFFYSTGLMEGTETVLFFVLFCLFPDRFATLAWIFGSLCWLTVGLRIAAGLRAFRNEI